MYEYYSGRLIDGKLVALYDFAFTVGIVVGIDSVGYERRYCYSSKDAAEQALSVYQNTNEHPSGEWIKCKGRFQGEAVDLLNPNFGKEE